MTVINLINVSSITPSTVAGAVTTSRASIIDVASDKVAKVNTLMISNIDGTNAADATVEISNDNGSTYYKIASTISVPADSTLDLIARPIYLDETDLIKGHANSANEVHWFISGTELID